MIRLFDKPILGYEAVTESCDEYCSLCEQMIHETAERAWDRGSKKAVSLTYLTGDDNEVTRHEVAVIRLFTVPHPTNEPF